MQNFPGFSLLILLEIAGKAWPENSPETQKKYRDLFVKHCVEALPNVTRTVQVGIVSALYNFVNKLCLLQKVTLSESEASQLSGIVNELLAAIKYSFSKLRFDKKTQKTNLEFTQAYQNIRD